ncbi:MAG TPA: hypothetical protein VGB96_12435, partial [Archangium sp.]
MMTSTEQTEKTKQTQLKSIIVDLPWRSDYNLGAGIDAVTGNVCNTAIQAFMIKESQNRDSSTNYKFIQNESELNKELDVSLGGSYNISGMTLSASASYLSQTKVSERDVVLVAKREVLYNDYDDVDAAAYALTDDAKKFVSDPKEFRSLYGDYFIAGYKRRSLCVVTYQCHSKSAEDMTRFM